MRRPRGDEGNALVEFTYLAVLLMVPLIYLLLAVFRVQSAAFGVTEAARQAGRAYARADDPAAGAAVGAEAARLAPGAVVRTSIRYTVQLPFVGGIFGEGHGGIPVTGVHVEVVDRFKQAP
jgi:Flp pilus assembly protein TadG